MKWTSNASFDADAPSLNTPVIVLNSPFSECAKTLLDPVRKRKAPESSEYAASEAATGATPTAYEAKISSKKTQAANYTSRRKRRKIEWLSLQIQRAMIADADGDRAIHIAVAQENVKMVQQLCLLMKVAGASLDIANHLRQTPLHVAVLVGNNEIVNLLLANGASVQPRDKRGNTPLQLAVKYFPTDDDKGKNVLNSLLGHPLIKCTLDSTDYDGQAAIHDAVSRHNVTAVRCLSLSDANLDVPDGKSGRTALACAILAGDLQMVKLLLECGSYAEHPDYGGQSCLDLALQSGNKTLIRLLEKKVNKLPSDHLNLSVSKPSTRKLSTRTANIKKRKHLKEPQ